MFDVKQSFKPKTVDECIDIMNRTHDAVIVAAGTDVMIKIKERKVCNAALVCIGELDELKGISRTDNGDIVIGAGTCFDDIYRNEIIRNCVPMLSAACNQVGSPQIRHIATIGGNLCNGAVSADSVPSLYALDAKLVIKNKNGEHIIPIEGFHTGPGETIINGKPEVLTSIIIPYNNFAKCGNCYIKFGQRKAMEIATLNCAVNLRLASDKSIDFIHIAYGVAAPIPVRVKKLEKMLMGKYVDESFYDLIKENASKELSPRGSWRASLELREQLIGVLGVRATESAVDMARRQMDNGNNSF